MSRATDLAYADAGMMSVKQYVELYDKTRGDDMSEITSDKTEMSEEDITRRALEAVADIAEQTERTPQAIAVSDQLVHRTAAALADVHAHAMARVEVMRDQLGELEQTIIEARQRAEKNVEAFMQIVTDGEESIRCMEQAVHRIGDHLLNGR